MFCIQCGNGITDSAKYCQGCGSAVQPTGGKNLVTTNQVPYKAPEAIQDQIQQNSPENEEHIRPKAKWGIFDFSNWKDLSFRQKINKAGGALFATLFAVGVLANVVNWLIPGALVTYIDHDLGAAVRLYDKSDYAKCADWKMASWIVPTESQAKSLGITDPNTMGIEPGTYEGCWFSRPGSHEVSLRVGIGRQGSGSVRRIKIDEPIPQH